MEFMLKLYNFMVFMEYMLKLYNPVVLMEFHEIGG